MNWIQWINFALMLATQILPLLKQIEEVVGPGSGAVKKTIATQVIEGAAAVPLTPEQQAIVSKLIDSTVTQLNIAGTLKK